MKDAEPVKLIVFLAKVISGPKGQETIFNTEVSEIEAKGKMKLAPSKKNLIRVTTPRSELPSSLASSPISE